MNAALFVSRIDWSLVIQSAGAIVVGVTILATVIGLVVRRGRQTVVLRVVRAPQPEIPLSNVQVSRLRTLTEHVPLAALIDFAFEGESEISATSRAAVAARPQLEEELAEMLVGEDRVRALKYLWLYMTECPVSLAAAFRECVNTLPAWWERRFPANGLSRSTEFEWACRAIPRLAARLGPSGTEFREPIAKLAQFIRSQDVPDATHYLVLLEGVAAEGSRKPCLGIMLWENCRGQVRSPLSPVPADSAQPVPGRLLENPLAL